MIAEPFLPRLPETDPRRKLSDAALAELRRRRATGEPTKALAHAYGISQGHVSNLCRDVAVTREPDVRLIARCLHAVADRFGVSDRALTGGIVRGRPRKDTPRARDVLVLLLRRFNVTYRDIANVVGAGDRVRSFRIVERARWDDRIRGVVDELAAAISAESREGDLPPRSEVGPELSIGKGPEREAA